MSDSIDNMMCLFDEKLVMSVSEMGDTRMGKQAVFCFYPEIELVIIFVFQVFDLGSRIHSSILFFEVLIQFLATSVMQIPESRGVPYP